MHVISRKAIREFCRNRPEAEPSLTQWYKVVCRARWTCFAEVKGTFNSVDLYFRCHIFDVGGNKYRIIAAVHYDSGKVYIRRVLTHAEYDRNSWKADCEAPKTGGKAGV